MNKNFLIENLKKLDREQINSFRKYLRANQQDKKGVLIKLYDYLRNLWPDLKEKDVQRGTIHQILYGKKEPIVEKRVNNLLYRLSQIMENYFLDEELGLNMFLRHQLLVSAYKRNGLHKSSRSEITKMMEIIDEVTYVSPQQYYNIYNANQALYFHINTDKNIPNHRLLINSSEAIDKFYILSKLKLIVESIVRKRLFKETISISFIKECINIGKQFAVSDSPVFGLYVKLIEQYLVGTSAQSFQSVIEEFTINFHLLDKNEQRDIYLHLVNKGSLAHNDGDLSFGKQLLTLLKIGTKYNFHIYRGTITSTSYINIAVVGSTQKDFAWAAKFIDQYKIYLPTKEKEDSEKLALAYLFFHQRDFKNTLRMLASNKGMHRQGIGLRGAALELRTFYELIENDFGYYEITKKAAERFLNRLAKMEKEGIKKAIPYIHFTELLQMFIRIHNRKGNISKNYWNKLTSKFHETRPLPSFSWISTQYKKLEKTVVK